MSTALTTTGTTARRSERFPPRTVTIMSTAVVLPLGAGVRARVRPGPSPGDRT